MAFSNLAIIDIETTGGNIKTDRIIEVGILLIDDNTVTKTWSTLINPGRWLDPAITMLTGIHSDQLETAPPFEAIADELLSHLRDRTFVAHFARFDYSFIKQEFARVGIQFAPDQLCSVKLSRKLFPQERHHGLDSIIQRFSISCENRHRAFDDAAVIWTFFQHLNNIFPQEHLQKALKEVSKRPALPTYIGAEEINKLPTTPGVYIFYDQRGCPIYVGKSINIKERVLSHFYADLTNSKEQKMKESVRYIESITTAGELEALLKESQLVKELKPVYNRKLRQLSQLCLVQLYSPQEYLQCQFVSVSTVTSQHLADETIAVFRSKREAEKKLKQLAEQYSLCWKLLGLEKTKYACFHYQLGYCHGACKKKEQPAVYNARMQLAFSQLRLQNWPFQGPIAISEYNEVTQQQAVHVFDQWCYVESHQDTESLATFVYQSRRTLSFDLDNYHILRQHLRAHRTNIIPLSSTV